MTEPCRDGRRTLTVTVVLACLLCLGASRRVHAVFVKQGGDDSAKGDYDAPVATIAEALRRIEPGGGINVYPGRFHENVVITVPGVRIYGEPGHVIVGTVEIRAPDFLMRELTVQSETTCVRLGPGASRCALHQNRFVVTGRAGLGLEIAGPNAGDNRIWDNQIHVTGARPTGQKYQFTRFARAEAGLVVRAADGNTRNFIHHNRVMGYGTGVLLGSPAGSTDTLAGTRLWHNDIRANTIGMAVYASNVTIDRNSLARNTSDGLIVDGANTTIEGNTLGGNLGAGLRISGATARNNVIVDNRGGGIVTSGSARLVHNTLHGNGGAALTVSTNRLGWKLRIWSENFDSLRPLTPDPERPGHHSDPVSSLSDDWFDDLGATGGLPVSDAPFPAGSGSIRLKGRHYCSAWRSIGQTHDQRSGQSFRAACFVYCTVPATNTNAHSGRVLCLTTDNRGEYRDDPDLSIGVDYRAGSGDTRRFTAIVWDGTQEKIVGRADLGTDTGYFVAIDVTYPPGSTYPDATFQITRATGKSGAYAPGAQWTTFARHTYDDGQLAYPRIGPAFKWVGHKWRYSPAKSTGDWWGIDDVTITAAEPVNRAATDTHTTFINNLVQHEDTLFNIDGRIDRDHNVYANRPLPEGAGPHCEAGKVAFVDPVRGDYRLHAGSAGIDAARPMKEATRDAGLAGRPVGKGPDAGAYECTQTPASARTFWLSPQGSDRTGDGSRDNPWGTLTGAALHLKPDDTLRLLAGTYTQGATLSCSGAEGHPITITAASGAKVVIAQKGIRLHRSRHVTLEGLTFEDIPHQAICFGEQAAYHTVRGNRFLNCPTHTKGGTSWAAGIVGDGPGASHILIEDNQFDRRPYPGTDGYHREVDVINPFEGKWNHHWIFRRNTVAGYEKLQLGTGSGTGYPSGYHLIEDNEFFQCNRAVHVKSSDNIIRGNYIHDLAPGYLRHPVGMVNRSGFRNVYERNRVENPGGFAGMFVLSDDHVVRNNVFIGSVNGVVVAYRQFGARNARHTWIVHNTFVNNVRAVHVDSRCLGFVYNNIIYVAPDRALLPPAAPAMAADGMGIPPIVFDGSWPFPGRRNETQQGELRADYNLYFNAEPPLLRNWEGGHNDLVADPMFVDPANGDFRLKAASPARGFGRSLDVRSDMDGRARPAVEPDAGAYQSEVKIEE
jgi:hypothetical protein